MRGWTDAVLVTYKTLVQRGSNTLFGDLKYTPHYQCNCKQGSTVMRVLIVTVVSALEDLHSLSAGFLLP